MQIDLTDPDLRQHLVSQARASRLELQALIRDAVAAGELVRGTSPTRLARTVEAILAGSMMSWAYHVEGTAAQRMRADFDAVLKPYLKPSKKR
ncbi:MAG: TetR family transcriptional regulator C-terminal domain-containing protein [Acidobacteriota bacterium]|nr:TetR family transcriptional regulator C-terminal domain-containing protein [Acidobacteriota bacterium]